MNLFHEIEFYFQYSFTKVIIRYQYLKYIDFYIEKHNGKDKRGIILVGFGLFFLFRIRIQVISTGSATLVILETLYSVIYIVLIYIYISRVEEKNE